MAKTYTPIATQKLTASAASVTFSSIPAIYTDLVLVTTVIAAAGGVEDYTPLMQVNGDTAANYSSIRLTGNGVSAATQGRTDQSFARIQTDGYLSSTIPQNSIINIMNSSVNSRVVRSIYTIRIRNNSSSDIGICVCKSIKI